MPSLHAMKDQASDLLHGRREKLSRYPEAKIELKAPSISGYILMSKEPVEELKKEFAIPEGTTHIFLPITDGASNPAIADGGCHWTLLLISLIDGVAFHYDSMSHSNEEPARVVTRKVEQILGKELKFCEMQDVPQQMNGEDCGVIVCLLMQHLLLKRLLQAGNREKVTMSMAGRELDATKGRKEMLRLLNEKRQQQLGGGS
ncbi:hypothetical protein H2199_008882 [Coniosporium tulheliwenetii]|uniref:Uncharacterized protein n=1 Tax=Coniosporium tulheliwenetii TaxID=3383036 RepID=A0ACC2YH17_9PEZI|nr:hypothetical protein H2199_008882 [Cladosporium sp. JES 115]